MDSPINVFPSGSTLSSKLHQPSSTKSLQTMKMNRKWPWKTMVWAHKTLLRLTAVILIRVWLDFVVFCLLSGNIYYFFLSRGTQKKRKDSSLRRLHRILRKFWASQNGKFSASVSQTEGIKSWRTPGCRCLCAWKFEPSIRSWPLACVQCLFGAVGLLFVHHTLTILFYFKFSIIPDIPHFFTYFILWFWFY